MKDQSSSKPTEPSTRLAPDRLWQLTADAVPALIAYVGADLRYRVANAHYHGWLGVDPGTMPGRHIQEVIGAAAWQTTKPYFERALTGETVIYEAEMSYAGTKPRWIHATYTPDIDPAGQVTGVAIMARDITIQKRSQENLAASELRFQSLLANASDIIYRENMPAGRLDYVSPSVRTVLGYAPEEYLALDVLTARTMVHLEDLPIIEAALARLEQTGQANAEYRQRTKAGEYRWLSNSMTLIRDAAGRPLYRDGSVRDITARKVAEAQLLQRMETTLQLSAQEFRTLAEAVPQIVWATRPDGGNIYFNQQWLDYTGLTREESAGHGWNTPFHPADKQRAWEAWQQAIQRQAPYALECRLRRADGVYRWWLIRAVPMRGPHGEILKWFGTCTDIEDLKRAEAALHEANHRLEQRVTDRTAALLASEQQFELLIQNLVSGVALINEQGALAIVNPAFRRIFGLAADSEIKKINDPDWSQWQVFDEQGALLEVEQHPVRKAVLTGRPVHDQLVALQAPGNPQRLWLLISAEPLIDNQGQVCRVIASYHDLTAHKQAEAALAAAHRQTQSLIDNTTSMIYACDLEERFVVVNAALAALLKATPEQVIGKRRHEFMPQADADAHEANDQKVIATGRAVEVEEHSDLHGRSITWWSTKFPLRDAQGRIYGVAGIVTDISARKQAEDRIKASLAEKEVLLKEIHHRVKNNLQVISSLVSLQAEGVADERVQAEFTEVRNRVRAMALVHEALYQSPDLARLDFADYSGRLMQHLWRAHRAPVGTVTFKLAVAPVCLPVDTAVSCGLILNELASNTLKHAFPNGRNGQVTVGLDHDPATRAACLWVQDDGIGLPAAMDWRQAPSLGLRLVQMLANQLRGTVATGTGPGTEFRVSFTLP